MIKTNQTRLYSMMNYDQPPSAIREIINEANLDLVTDLQIFYSKNSSYYRLCMPAGRGFKTAGLSDLGGIAGATAGRLPPCKQHMDAMTV